MAQHSRKGAAFQAVTANRLSDGVVVYLTQKDEWSPFLNHADIANQEDAQDLLARGQKASHLASIDPYLFEITKDKGEIRAVSQREKIRTQGPSVDFGDHHAGDRGAVEGEHNVSL